MAFKIANAHASPNPKSALFALDAGKPHAPAHHAQRERRADERDRQEDANADQHDEQRELTPKNWRCDEPGVDTVICKPAAAARVGRLSLALIQIKIGLDRRRPSGQLAAQPMLALLATLAIQALVSMSVLTPPVLAVLAAREIGIASERIGVFTAMIYTGAILSSSASGLLLARTGPLRLSQWCLAFCALGLGVAASGVWPLLVVGAVLMGIGYGPVTPASSHILIRQTAPGRRSLMFSLKQTGVPLGGALAGFLAPPLALVIGWQGAALVVAVACLAVATAVQPLRAAFDNPHAHGTSGSTHFLAGFRLVFRMAVLRRLALSSIAFAATQLSFATFLVTFLTERAGISLVTAGIVMAVAQGAGVVGRIGFGWIADRFIHPGLLLTLLGLGMALASLATGFITADWPIAAVFVATALLGVTGLAWNGVYLAEVARLAPEGAAGTATGGALAVTFLGIVFGPAAFGAVVSLSGSYALAFSLLAIGASLGGLGVRHIGR